MLICDNTYRVHCTIPERTQRRTATETGFDSYESQTKTEDMRHPMETTATRRRQRRWHESRCDVRRVICGWRATAVASPVCSNAGFCVRSFALCEWVRICVYSPLNIHVVHIGHIGPTTFTSCMCVRVRVLDLFFQLYVFGIYVIHYSIIRPFDNTARRACVSSG